MKLIVETTVTLLQLIMVTKSVLGQTPSTKFNVTATWMQGNNVLGVPAVIGVPGAFSADPYPGARSQHCSASVSVSGSDMFFTYGGTITSGLCRSMEILQSNSGDL